MSLYLVLLHVQDSAAKPIANASASAVSLNVDWASVTNACGDVINPGSGIAGVMLSPGQYAITFSAAGYQPRVLPVTILAEGPPILVGLDKAASVLPAPPTRSQICGIKTSLAGLTYQTSQFGPIPAWFYAGLNETDRQGARNTHKAAGDTHIPIPITEAYRESGTLWPDALREGYDFTQDIPAFRAILIETIADGMLIDMPLGGDGQGAGPGYNDPVGKTYGFQWLMDNLPRIVAGLKGDGTPDNPDLTPYIIFRPGWDGVFGILLAVLLFGARFV